MIKSFFTKSFKTLACISVFIIYSCGSTSSLSSKKGINNPDLTIYENVVVELFSDRTKKNNVPDYFLKNFQDKITSSIKEKNIFESVEDKIIDSTNIKNTLLIKGFVTRYSEGNPTLKLMVGFGAGSSYLDAKVYLVNGPDNIPIGTIDVDKNSWALGGAIAASQTVETFMEGASKKIAKELEKLKTPKKN